MFTQKRIQFEETTGDAKKDWKSLVRSIREYLQGLEFPGSIGITQGTVQSSNISSSVVNTVIPVSYYGAVGDGTTDDTLAITLAAAAVVANGGGTILFDAGKTYKVWTATTYPTLMDFDDLENVTIQGNGATFVSAQTNAAIGLTVISASGTSGLHVRDLNFTGSNTTLTLSTGERFLFFDLGNAKNLSITNCVTKNCLGGIQKLTATNGYSRGLSINNFYCEKVFYPLNVFYTNDVTARGFVTRNCGRSYFPIAPCWNHDIHLDSQPAFTSADCLLKVYALQARSVEDNTIANIKLNYRTSGRYAGSGDCADGIVQLDYQEADVSATAAGHMANIHIHFDVDGGSGTDQFTDLLSMNKYAYNGSADTAGRGHTLKNLTISGRAINWNNALGAGVKICEIAGGEVWSNGTSGTAELVSGVVLRDLQILGTPAGDAIYINGQAFANGSQSVTMDNIYCDGNITYANITNGNISLRGVKAANSNTGDNKTTTFTPTWTGSGGNPAIGNGTLAGKWSRQGEMVDINILVQPGNTTTFGAGNYTIGALPFTVNSDGVGATGNVWCLEGGVQYHTGVCLFAAGAATLTVFMDSPTGGQWGAAAPWAFKNTDSLQISGRYRANT